MFSQAPSPESQSGLFLCPHRGKRRGIRAHR
uniref:Uncharacterized protein n=1 Tax=Myoviridae sp. ctZhz2 TaxID=2825129 RepID=A0A8S5U8S4_9CAUD|nr:MAG TPA: hypothetical protein [Myoviridae sp. ctZhz2]